ncbi:hypothetical protein Glove_186g159 [Diversispora epigaea]|uniref:SWIM-type domain-containing protein n=1 Tax=Diversispora epigaea TaxID=1348612 RepID=A0A397IQM0_9GLOM|nr:hypothetical protein Glove_186g159 [Diversispora epigaea]
MSWLDYVQQNDISDEYRYYLGAIRTYKVFQDDREQIYRTNYLSLYVMARMNYVLRGPKGPKGPKEPKEPKRLKGPKEPKEPKGPKNYINDDIFREIHKFPFPIQKLIVSEILSVENRIEKSKDLSRLMSLECQCLFFRKYMLPCKHIFHEQIHSSRKLLTIDTWKQSQAAENRKLTINELMERTRNEYWNIEENGDKKEKRKFLKKLKTCLDPIFKKK